MGRLRDVLHGWLHSNWWLWWNFRAFARHLRLQHEIVGLVPFARASWHRGSRYFRASDAAGHALFIKTDGDHHLLANEVAAWRVLSQQDHQPAHFVPVRCHDLAGDHPFAAFDWVAARTLGRWPAPLAPANAEFVAHELGLILTELRRAGLIHRDITPENLLAVGKGDRITRVLLIDFAFVVLQGAAPCDDSIPALDLEHLGHGYKPAPWLWDDAFSCHLILRRLFTPGHARGRELMEPFARQIGTNVFSRKPA